MIDELDELTITAIAEVICGDDTIYYRTASELVKFFRRAGWDHITVYDGDYRRAWTVHQLTRQRQDHLAIERVICRLADRREYPDQPDVADDVLATLNRILDAENIHLERDGNLRPHLRAGRAQPTPQFGLDRTKLLYPIEEIVANDALLPLFRQRIDEIVACRDTGCYLAAVILSGSLLEGVLLDAAESRTVPDEIWQEPAAKKADVSKPKHAGGWSLHSLAYAAHRLGWIDTDAHELIAAVRKFRNMVHVHQQRQAVGNVPDENTVDMFWPIVIGTLNDLGRTKPTTR